MDLHCFTHTILEVCWCEIISAYKESNAIFCLLKRSVYSKDSEDSDERQTRCVLHEISRLNFLHFKNKEKTISDKHQYKRTKQNKIKTNVLIKKN